jgi:formylglycine-generating enzyme required for sulfatase activity
MRERRRVARWLPWAAVLLLAVLVGSASAQRTIGVQPVPGATSPGGFYTDSWAVIIGINDYQHPRVPKLRYAVNDARAIEGALLAQGFRRDRVITLLDRKATRSAIEEVLGDDLRSKVGKDDRVLVFFAGHGKTDRRSSGDEEGYLIPVDGDPGKLYSTAISMEGLRRLSDRIPAKHILYVMDACYSGYAIYNRAISDDLLDEMVKKPAIQILTAGRQGDQAQERDGHGVFTQVLLRGLQGDAFAGKGWLALEELGVWMKQRVYAESGKQQLPQFGNLSGEGQFVFLRPGAKLAAVPPPAEPPRLQGKEEIRQEFGTLALSARLSGVDVWLGDQKVWTSRPGAAYVLSNVPIGPHRLIARKDGHKEWQRDVQVAANQRAELVIDIEPLRPEPPKAARSEDGAEMVLVPAGEFTMGSNDNDAREKPPHRVYLDAFSIDKYETTNALFDRFVRATGHRTTAEQEGWAYAWAGSKFDKVNGAAWRAPNGPGSAAETAHPVVQVSWTDADAYCKWAGKRLPTEAEWEKAARGTDGRKYPWGEQWDASRANSSESKLGKAAPVGSYSSGVSPYGAHDMAGNAWEWVADRFDASYYKNSPERNPKGPDSGTSRVLRGGSWSNSPIPLRAAYRRDVTPDHRGSVVGFRCARGAS